MQYSSKKLAVWIIALKYIVYVGKLIELLHKMFDESRATVYLKGHN